MAPNAPKLVTFRRNNFILPIYVKPLHAWQAWGMGSPNIDDTDHSLLAANHPCHGQMDAALLLLDDPRISAKVHQLWLLDQEDHQASIVKLCHCLETPLGPQHHTIEQQECDTYLMEEWVAQQECHAAISMRLVAAAAMSRVLPIFHGIYSEKTTTYLAEVYLSKGQPATLWGVWAKGSPQVLPIYIPPPTQPWPMRPHHTMPSSPSKIDDGFTLFEDNIDGEAWVRGSTLIRAGVMLRFAAWCYGTLILTFYYLYFA